MGYLRFREQARIAESTDDISDSFRGFIVQADPDLVQQAYTCSVKTDRRITMVMGALELAERVGLFLKYARHSHLMHADDFRACALADPLVEVVRCFERNG